jgi:hypothetical protein
MAAMHQTMAAKLTMVASWPGTTAISPCDPTNGCTGDMSRLVLVLAIDYTIDPSTMKFSGTMRTCDSSTPPVPLTAFGAQASGFPMGSEVLFVTAKDVWDKQPTVNVTGSAANGSFVLDDVTALTGLKADSMWKDPKVMWPPPSTKPMTDPSIPMSDWDTSDMNLNMGGITGSFKADMAPFVVPHTALSTTSAQTDQGYVVVRTEMSFNGCMTSCTEGSGTASVPLYQNHFIGCHIPAGDAGAARLCTPAEYNFIDANTTVYTVVSGTLTLKVVPSGSGEGGAVNCADVRAAVP